MVGWVGNFFCDSMAYGLKLIVGHVEYYKME